MQPYPRFRISFGWDRLPHCPGFGHWVSYYCVAFVIWSGLCLGVGFGNAASPGWGFGWVCLGTVCGVAPLWPAGVCGVCGGAWVSACTPPFLVRVLGRAWFCARSACSPPFLVLVCRVGVRAGVWVSAVPHHSLGRCWGVCVLVCPSCMVSCTSWLRVLCGGVWLGLGWCCALPLLAGALGRVCVCVRAPLVPRLSLLGCAVWACVLGSGFGCAPLFLVGLLGCVCSRACALLAPALPGGPPVARVCAGVAVFFLGGAGRVVSWLCGVGRRLSWSWVLVVSVPPSPLSCAAFFFFFCRPSVVCVRVFWVSLLLVGRCSWLGVAGFGWVVPLCPFVGSRLRCCLDRGFGRLSGCWWAVSWLWAVLPPPALFFFWGGLPVPPVTIYGLAHALVGIQCGLPGCCWWLRFARPCPGPMGQVGYVHAGLEAPSCRVRFWLCRPGGCARRLRVALG